MINLYQNSYNSNDSHNNGQFQKYNSDDSLDHSLPQRVSSRAVTVLLADFESSAYLYPLKLPQPKLLSADSRAVTLSLEEFEALSRENSSLGSRNTSTPMEGVTYERHPSTTTNISLNQPNQIVWMDIDWVEISGNSK